jgi:hypothetical protein
MLVVMGFVMGLHGSFVMVAGMKTVRMSEVGVMRGLLVMTILVVLGGFAMMLCGVLMVVSGLEMVIVRFRAHNISP